MLEWMGLVFMIAAQGSQNTPLPIETLKGYHSWDECHQKSKPKDYGGAFVICLPVEQKKDG